MGACIVHGGLHAVSTVASSYLLIGWKTGLPRIVKPIEKAPICLFLEEVAMHAGRKVFNEIYYSNSLIVGDPQGILDQHLTPCPILLLNYIYCII
jgi:hypothetical protein